MPNPEFARPIIPSEAPRRREIITIPSPIPTFRPERNPEPIKPEIPVIQPAEPVPVG